MLTLSTRTAGNHFTRSAMTSRDWKIELVSSIANTTTFLLQLSQDNSTSLYQRIWMIIIYFLVIWRRKTGTKQDLLWLPGSRSNCILFHLQVLSLQFLQEVCELCSQLLVVPLTENVSIEERTRSSRLSNGEDYSNKDFCQEFQFSI